MPFALVDDVWFTNPKVTRLSKDAKLLYLAGNCYCSRNLTDGVLTKTAVRIVLLEVTAKPRHVTELHEAGFWDRLEDGYLVHDWHDINRPAEEIKQRRKEISEKRREAGKKGAEEKWRRDRIDQSMRQEVARRIGGQPGLATDTACTYCQTKLIIDWTNPDRVRFLDTEGRTTPELDHVIALAVGGAHDVDNLRLACLRCNRSRGSGKPGKPSSNLPGPLPMPLASPSQEEPKSATFPIPALRAMP